MRLVISHFLSWFNLKQLLWKAALWVTLEPKGSWGASEDILSCCCYFPHNKPLELGRPQVVLQSTFGVQVTRKKPVNLLEMYVRTGLRGPSPWRSKEEVAAGQSQIPHRLP